MLHKNKPLNEKGLLADALRFNLFRIALIIVFVSTFICFLLEFDLSEVLNTFVRLGFLLVLLSLFFISKSRFNFACYVLVFGSQLFALHSHSNSELSVASFFWIALAPVYSILLLGKITGLIDTIIYFILSFIVFTKFHLYKFDVFPAEPIFQTVLFCIALTIFIYYFENVRKKLYKQARAQMLARIKAEEALRDYKHAIESSRDIIAVIDQAFQYKIVNQAFLSQRRLSRSQVIGQSLSDIMGKDAFQQIKPYIERCFNGENLKDEIIMEYPELGQRTMQIHFYPIINDYNEITSVVYLKQDITAFKKLETERQRLFTLSIDPMCVAGFDGKFTDLNPAWERILGWSQEEMKKTPWLNLVHPDDREATEKIGEKLIQGEPVFNFQNRYLCKDGSYRWLSWNSYPKVSWQQIFGVARDITDQKQMEAEKEELIGKLKQALEEVKTLQGIIPICSHCKKIRDEAGAWSQLEEYISKKSDASFSHGICPDCIKKYFPEYKNKL